jgi:protein-L-isoaspartate(D-aspartate) O-methyltransferase
MPDFVAQRQNMVASQILASGVTDERLMNAFAEVPRERFVPSAKRGVAYADAAIEVVPGRRLLEPRTLAMLLRLAEIDESDSVLDVGCATGYSTAVLAAISRRVTGLEQDADLVRVAEDALRECGCRNASVVQGSLVDGHRGDAPYNVIVVEGAFEQTPEPLIAQLAEGGRLVGILQRAEQGHAVLYLKEQGRIGRRIGFDASARVLSGFRRAAEFVL